MEETAVTVGTNAPWFVSIIISLITISGTVITSWLSKKRLEEEIARQNKVISEQNDKIRNLKEEAEQRAKEAELISKSYLTIVEKLKTLRDFEIAVDGKDIAKLLNKGL